MTSLLIKDYKIPLKKERIHRSLQVLKLLYLLSLFVSSASSPGFVERRYALEFGRCFESIVLRTSDCVPQVPSLGPGVKAVAAVLVVVR